MNTQKIVKFLDNKDNLIKAQMIANLAATAVMMSAVKTIVRKNAYIKILSTTAMALAKQLEDSESTVKSSGE